MNVIEPGQDSHKVLAMGSSRKFGLDAEAKETVQPQPYSLAGHGAGSIFKIFTVAAAMEQGLGTSAVLDVPSRYTPAVWATAVPAAARPTTTASRTPRRIRRDCR